MLDRLMSRWVPLLVWIVTIITIILIPLAVIGHGYMPADDALRQAAAKMSMGQIVAGVKLAEAIGPRN